MPGVLVLGSGSQARRLSEAARKVPGLELLGLWSRSPERGKAAADEARTTPFQDLDRALALPGLEIVLVGTESARHAAPALAAVRAGKHVLLEKPIDVDPAQAETLVREAKARSVRLAVVAQKRFSGRFLRIRRAVESGSLGRIVSASVLLRIHRGPEYFREGDGWRGDAARGGGVLLNQGIHYLDLLGWWLGEFESARGLEGPRPEGLRAPGTVAGTVRFKSGAVATVLLSTDARRGPPEAIEIVGERGAIQLEGGRIRVWDVPGEGTRGLLGPLTRKLPLPLRTALTVEALSAPKDGTLEDQLAEFAQAVREGRDPRSTGEEGLRALRMALALGA